VELIPKYQRASFMCWYSGDVDAEEATANALVERLFGTDFEVTRNTDIGHTVFEGDWHGLHVMVRTGPGAFCERVKVGTQIIPAEPARDAVPEHVEDVYEWRCADPIVKAVAS